MYYKLDENKEAVPCDVEEFILGYQDFENKKRVALTVEPNVFNLSTVFLGLDHGFGHGVLLFESLLNINLPRVRREGDRVIYGYDLGGYYDGYMDRYKTYQEAVEGHEKILRELRGFIAS